MVDVKADYRTRTQIFVYQIWKEYEGGYFEMVEQFPTFIECKDAFDSYGGKTQLYDYHGPFRLYMDEKWITVDDNN